MTRAEAKQKLIEIGVAEPTEEQITNLLDSVSDETKKEKERADKLKEKADKADELQGQLDDLQTQGLSDAEKANKALDEANKKISELTANTFKSEAKAILKGSGLEDADIEVLLPGMVAGLEKVEDVQERTNAYVNAMNKVRDNAIKEHEKDVLDGTETPGGDNPPNETKTEAEKFAESIGKEISGSGKDSASIISAYTD